MEKIKLPERCPGCNKEWFVHRFACPIEEGVSYDCRNYGKQDHNFRFHCKGNKEIESIEIEINSIHCDPWYRAYFHPNEKRLFVLRDGWMIFEQFTYEGSSKEEYEKLRKEKIIPLKYFEPDVYNWKETVEKVQTQIADLIKIGKVKNRWCPTLEMPCQPPEDWDETFPFICARCGHTIGGMGC